MIQELPKKRGTYRVQIQSRSGKKHTLEAWFNPMSAHWLTCEEVPHRSREIGFAGSIQHEGEDCDVMEVELLSED